MQRRNFVKHLLVLFGAPGAAIASTRLVAAPRRILIQESPLAGFQYHAGKDIWPRLSVGDSLTLVREEDNAHDQRAVRIDWRSHTLGYVPRRENTAVSQMLDRGERLHARISALRHDHDPWQRVRLAITLES